MDPMVDNRYQGVLVRNASGSTLRSPQVITAFKRQWSCPATNAHAGMCAGWAIDHVVSIEYWGVDAVWNMQWLPDQIKRATG